MWLKKTKDAQSWALNSHYLPDSPIPRGWEEWWYWLGLVPIEGWQRTPHITQALIKQTAQILAEAGYGIWTNRNAATKEWESTVGIGPHQGSQQGSQSEQHTDHPPAKRGRPPKPDEDRSQPYRDHLAHKRRVNTLLQLQDASGSPIYTTKAARRRARKDGATERKARSLSQHAEHLNLRKLTHFTTPLPQPHPIPQLDQATIQNAIASNNPIIATPLTQQALSAYNQKATRLHQRPVTLEYENRK